MAWKRMCLVSNNVGVVSLLVQWPFLILAKQIVLYLLFIQTVIIRTHYHVALIKLLLYPKKVCLVLGKEISMDTLKIGWNCY